MDAANLEGEDEHIVIFRDDTDWLRGGGGRVGCVGCVERLCLRMDVGDRWRHDAASRVSTRQKHGY